MINIKEYHNLLREYNIEENNGHLLLKNARKQKSTEIVRKLFLALGDLRAENKNFSLRKTQICQFSNCVSPQCYRFNLKPTFEHSILSREDVMEIAEDMDLFRIEEIGPVAYLKEYNATQPDILKISEQDFRTIYAYMKGEKC